MQLGSVVLLHGSVQGMGRQAKCEVLARRIVTSGAGEAVTGRSYAYIDCSVIGAPYELPDGEYVAGFEDYTLKVTHLRGVWLSCGPAIRNTQVAAFED